MILLLNDGTVVEGGRAGLSDGVLWLWFPGWTLQAVAGTVFREGALNKIIWHINDDEDDEVYIGFTTCSVIMNDGDDISVCLKKG